MSIEVITKSSSRREVLAPYPVEVVSRNSQSNPGVEPQSQPSFGEGLRAMAKLDAAQTAAETNGGVSATFSTGLWTTDENGVPSQRLDLGQPYQVVATALHGTLAEGGGLAAITGMAVNYSHGGASIDVRQARVPLKPLRQDEIEEVLAPKSNGETRISLQHTHSSLLQLDQLDYYDQIRLLMLVSGVAPEQVSIILNSHLETEKTPLASLLHVDTREIETLKIHVLPKLFSKVSEWQKDRPLKMASSPEEALRHAKDYYLFAHLEAQELLHESLNQTGLDQDKALKKEACDILVFLLQALNDSRRYSSGNPWEILMDANQNWLPASIDMVGKAWTNQILQSSSAEEAIVNAFTPGTHQWAYYDSWQHHSEPNIQPSLVLGLDLVLRYLVVKGWDLGQIMDETLLINNFNYPRFFFHPEVSPVSDSKTATRLLRFLRKAQLPSNLELVTGLQSYHQMFPEDLKGNSPTNADELRRNLYIWTITTLGSVYTRYPLDHKYRMYAADFLQGLELSDPIKEQVYSGY